MDFEEVEKGRREGLSGSGLLLLVTRAWRQRVGGGIWLPWFPRNEEEDEETTTGTTAA